MNPNSEKVDLGSIIKGENIHKEPRTHFFNYADPLGLIAVANDNSSRTANEQKKST